MHLSVDELRNCKIQEFKLIYLLKMLIQASMSEIKILQSPELKNSNSQMK